jgi:hypothetical protein
MVVRPYRLLIAGQVQLLLLEGQELREKLAAAEARREEQHQEHEEQLQEAGRRYQVGLSCNSNHCIITSVA